jgi:hypothetical protein
MRGAVVIVLTLVVLSGCSSYTVAKYGISPDNATALRAVGPQPVNVGEFRATKAGRKDIMCRGVGPIKAPDGGTFEDYVRKALIDELRVAGSFAESAPVTLTGNLDEVDFNSNSGKWTLGLTLTSSTGRSLNVVENYAYDTSFVGEKACALTGQAFGPAVQSLIGKVVKSPEFVGLLK